MPVPGRAGPWPGCALYARYRYLDEAELRNGNSHNLFRTGRKIHIHPYYGTRG